MTARRPVLLDAIRLDRSDEAGIAAQIHAAIRVMVIDGTLAPGARLPSSRALATSWGVARNTVVAAIERLIAEGFLAAERGSSAYVAELAGTALLRDAARAPAPAAATAPGADRTCPPAAASPRHRPKPMPPARPGRWRPTSRRSTASRSTPGTARCCAARAVIAPPCCTAPTGAASRRCAPRSPPISARRAG